MRVNKENITSFMLAFFIFMILNLPSLKIIYSSSLLNLIALGGLWIVGCSRSFVIGQEGIGLNNYKLNYIMQFLLIWTSLFWMTLIQHPSTFTLGSTLKFISVILFALGVVFFTKKSELKYVFLLQLIWGIVLALSEVTVGIPKDRNLGQHYLTTGVPIALTIVMIFGYIYSKQTSNIKKIGSVPFIFILYLGLFSLNGRAPILFSVAVSLIIVFIGVFFEKVKLIKYSKLIVYPLIAIFFLYILFINLPEDIMDRFLRMFQTVSEEPRFEVYLESIEVIINNPHGIGLQGYVDLNLGYPHNIFLEIIMSGGILMIIPLTMSLVSISKMILQTIQYRKDGIVCLAMMLYLFLTWNVSFELSGSYILFTIISLYVVSSEDLAIERKQLKKPVIFASDWNNNVSYISNEKSLDR